MQRALILPLVLAILPAAPARALPLLRLVLHGDARTLGEGAADLFPDARRDALRLARPALLAEVLDAPLLTAGLDDEATLSVSGPTRYAGTSASDRRARTAFLVPLPSPWQGARVAIAVRLASEAGAAKLERSGGELLRLWEGQETLGVTASFSPAPWMALGASYSREIESHPSWSTEVLLRRGPFLAGWRRTVERTEYGLLAPAGLSRKIKTPPVAYDIERTQGADYVLFGFEHARADALLRLDLRWPHDVTAHLNARLGSSLLLRLAYEHQTWAFDDFARVASEDVARINLGVDRERTALGAEHPLLGGVALARYVRTRLVTQSVGGDTGAASRALLDMDLDLRLFFGHDLQLDVHQISLGYRQDHARLSWRAGAQALRILRRQGDLRYGSELLAFLLEEESIEPARADLVALTGGLGLRLGRWEMWWSVAQLVPVDIEATARPSPPPPIEESGVPRPPPPPGPGLLERVRTLSSTYHGGTLHTVELVHRF